MSPRTSALLASMDEHGDRSGRWMLELFDAIEADPNVAMELALHRLSGDERLNNETMRVVVGFVPFLELPQLVEAGLKDLEQGGELYAAFQVLEHVADQSPEAFHPYLERVFEQIVKNADAEPAHFYCVGMTRPWIRSGKSNFEFLKGQLKRSTRRRRLAWYAMLRTGSNRVYSYAREHVNDSGFATLVLHDVLMNIGIEMDRSPLFADEALAIAYESDGDPNAPLPPEPTWSDVMRRRDPTFNSRDRLPHAYPFGGALEATCGMCRKPLHRMIRLDPVPETLARICTVKSLDLATCYSCSGWIEGILYFCHDDAGELTDPWWRRTREAKPEFPSAPIVPTTVTLGRADARWNVLSPFSGNQDRVGGAPVWIQQAQFPPCPSCGKDMPFVAQLGRDDYPTTDGGHVQFGSGGTMYAFWCDKCKVSANFWQCT